MIPLMRYRRHTASSAFSDRMWRSREIYAAKLAAEFPDDPDLSRFYVRDVIAPRFFLDPGVSEYLRISLAVVSIFVRRRMLLRSRTSPSAATRFASGYGGM